MLTLLLTVGLSIIFSIFATQNTSAVSLNFANYISPSIPVYLAILIPVLLTIVVALFIQGIKNFAMKHMISNQKNTIKNLKRELAEVTKEYHKMELENAKFKNELGEPVDEDSI